MPISHRHIPTTVALLTVLALTTGCHRKSNDDRTAPSPESSSNTGPQVPTHMDNASRAQGGLLGGTDSATGTGNASSAPGDSGTSAKALSASELAFVQDATESNLYEIAVAKLASDKAQNAGVKSMALTLVEDHTGANQRLSQLVGTRATLPASIPADKQKIIDDLSKTSGVMFDRQFIETVGLKDHRTDIQKFENGRSSVKDGGLRDFIEATLPVLKHHLSMAQDLAKALGIQS